MLAILGAGFGLYGYLPALIGLHNQRVLLPARYRPRFDARPELQPVAHGIDWVADDEAAMAGASGVVLALPPHVQPSRAVACLTRDNIKWMLLEKPLAADPAAARMLLEQLGTAGKRFRIGYLFRHTGWGRGLLADRPGWTSAGTLMIRWAFMAHHFETGRDNWKRRTAQGGGALRFFGVHLVALLAELGYDDVVQSTGWGRAPAEIERWEARFTGPYVPDCQVAVDSRHDAPCFTIGRPQSADSVASRIGLQTPFDACTPPPSLAGADRRIALLGEVYASLWEDHDYVWYSGAIALWQRAEAIMVLKLMN